MRTVVTQVSYVDAVVFPDATLRKWAKRYKQCGIAGLESQSRLPHLSPDTKVTDELRALILTMREKRNLGARRLQTELFRLHQIHLSTTTLHKVLSEAPVKPIVTYRRTAANTVDFIDCVVE